MTAGPLQAALPQQAAPAAETGQAELIEMTFTPAEPQLTPGAARAVLALLLRARETAQARDRPEGAPQPRQGRRRQAPAQAGTRP
jgi:hypothetical protein